MRLKRAGRLSTEVSWHRNFGRKRHQRLRGLEGCLLPVATANALGMALVALLTTSSSGPAACEQLARKALERVVEGGGGVAAAVEGLVKGLVKPRPPTRKRANLIGLACKLGNRCKPLRGIGRRRHIESPQLVSHGRRELGNDGLGSCNGCKPVGRISH